MPPSGINLINESGLYSLILSSKRPEAILFKHWITKTVLPSIRKNGFYNAVSIDPPRTQIPALPPLGSGPYTPVRHEPNFDEILKAADLLIRCDESRLPYVLAMLKRYGFEFPKVPRKASGPARVKADSGTNEE